MMNPNAQKAIEFLRALGSPRVLIAIHPDTGEVQGLTPDTSPQAAAWIERVNKGRNVHFTVNRTRRPMTKKPKKVDMAWMDFAHVELDPPKSIRSSPEWRQRVRDKLNALPYPPTLIWESGNGAQALWRLKTPVRLIDAKTIAKCEAVNRGLLEALRSDDIEVQGTHNIERLLRIPYTVNYPNRAKRDAGRTVEIAGNVEHHPDRVYDFDVLPKAEALPELDVSLSVGEPVFLDDLSDLPTAGWVKHLIETCNDDGKYPSRSEAEFAALCQMVRDQIPDETILGILTDSRWRISERVLEHGNGSGERSEEYAMKEIANAHKKIAAELQAEFEDDDWLEGGVPGEEEECSEYTADAFDGVDAPEQEWIVDNMVPADDVTLNMGDGGAGKTTVMLQLLVAKTVGKPWLNKDTGDAARTIFFSGEERRAVINRRLNAIINGASSPYQGKERITWSGLADFKILGLSDRDALLAIHDRSSGRIKATALYDWVDRKIGEWKPALVVFDALYDIYGGDENAKAQVRQFVSLMRKLTGRHKCAIIVTGHPSLFGMASGSGTSGSTAWNNAFRSRLYTTKEKSKRGVALHKIASMKQNYGEPDAVIETYWENGVFVPIFEDEEARLAEKERAKAKFLELTAIYVAEGRAVTTAGPTFAPTVFANDHRSEGFTKADFKDAMNMLFADRKIEMRSYRKPDRKMGTRIEPTT